jgi:transposase-like protein
MSHCVWLYFRFTLSFRDVEEMLAMRGVLLMLDTEAGSILRKTNSPRCLR